jgi:hypothetical protein
LVSQSAILETRKAIVMAKKKPRGGQGTFAALRSMKAIPTDYDSGDKPNPDLRSFVEQKSTPYDPENDDLRHPGLQPAGRHDEGGGDLQHARLLVEEAAPGHPATQVNGPGRSGGQTQSDPAHLCPI